MSQRSSQMLLLSHHESEKFHKVLRTLKGSKDSIKAARKWIVKHFSLVKGIAQALYIHMNTLTSFQQKLHLVYLMNDVLHAFLNHQQLSGISAFAPYVMRILKHAYTGHNASDQNRVLRVGYGVHCEYE